MKSRTRQEASRLAARVRRAWVAGIIPRLPCQRCGTEQQLVAHHEDYSKPLEVTWLCRPHHAERHKELRAMAKSRLSLS